MCGKGIKRTWSEKNHKPGTGDQPHICEFDTKLNLHSHHTEMIHVSEICRQDFTFKGSLENYYLTSTGMNPHVCELCGKGFSNKRDLHDHSLIHSREKPHICELCGKYYKYKGALKKHYWSTEKRSLMSVKYVAEALLISIF
ncbi:hypothetical protein TNCV_1554261 [Trichonephila clavipes]|nr:hypothetical protein TNCV_1554261 [Trichonephila clavipes]